LDGYAFVFWPIFAGIQMHLNLVEVKKYSLYFSLLLIILVGVAIDIILLGFYKAWSMQ
jgi:hypothetical protein